MLCLMFFTGRTRFNRRFNSCRRDRSVEKRAFKWPGSKAWLGRDIAELGIELPGRVVEPFAGGCGFFANSNVLHAHLVDSNYELTNCLRQIRNQLDSLLVYLASARNCIEHYSLLKHFQGCDPVQRAARFIFLLNTAWGGCIAKTPAASLMCHLDVMGGPYMMRRHCDGSANDLSGPK